MCMMKRFFSSFALAAGLLLSALVPVQAETIDSDLSSVGATGVIRVTQDGTIFLWGYVTCTVTKMPTSSNSGCLRISNLTDKDGHPTTNMTGAIAIEGTIYDKSGRKFIVNEIAANTFKDCSKITAIKLGTLTSFKSIMDKYGFVIGANAFQNCSALAAFVCESGTLTVANVGNNAFDGCTKLTDWGGKVTGGDVVVGSYAFRNCSSLKSLIMAGEIDEHAFDGCTAVEKFIWYGNGKGHSSQFNYTVNSSPIYPLRGSLKEVTLYSGVPGYMFYSCTELTTVSTPADIWDRLSNINIYEMGIGNRAFASCPALKSAEIAGQISATAFPSCPKLVNITYRGAYMGTSSQPEDRFLGFLTSATELTTLKIESTSSKTVPNVFVPDYLCAGLEKLSSVSIPNYVTTIGIGAFMACSALPSLTLPASVKYIDASAFEDCSSLATCPIGASNSALKSIGKRAFAGTAMNSFYVPESVNYLGGQLLDGCKSVKEILFFTRSLTKSAIGGSYENLFFAAKKEERKNVEKFFINPELTVIPDSLFYGFSGLQRLVDKNGASSLPALKTIEQAAFYGCSSLWDSYGPNQLPNVTTVGASAFEGSNFHNIELPKLKTMGKRAFANTTLMYIHDMGSMPELTAISEEAFAENAKLATAEFNGIATIGERAFFNDGKLKTINILNTVPAIQANSFEGCEVQEINTNCKVVEELKANSNWMAVCSNVVTQDNNYKYPSYMDNFWCRNSTMEIVEELNCEGVFVVKAIADEGYEFVYWNDGNTDNPRTIDLNEYYSDWLYSWAYAPSDYHQTNFTCVPEGSGYLSITNEFGHKRDNQKFLNGEVAHITPKELNGWYKFDHWDFVKVEGGEDPTPCDFEYNPTELCVNISYMFDPMGGGGYDPETGMPIEPSEPVEQAQFDENGKAVYVLKEVPVTIISCSDVNGSVALSESYSKVGGNVTLTATPKEGYEFDQWEDGNKDAVREVTLMPALLIENRPSMIDPESGEYMYEEYPVDMGDGMLEIYNSESEYIFRLCAQFKQKAPTALDNTNAEVKAIKMFRNGALYILIGDKTYDATGRLVK